MCREQAVCVLSSACDMLEMSVDGVCDMCMCLARGGGECMTGLGLGFTNSGGTSGKWDMCFGCGGVGGVAGEWVGRLGLGGLGGVMSVCVVSLDSLC